MEKKHKKRWIVLAVVLALVLALLLTGVLVMKRYLQQINRTDPGTVETVPPEEEFFDVDVTPEPTASPAPTGSPEPTGTPEPSKEPEQPNPMDDVIDPNDVEWPFIEKIEDDRLINLLLVGQDRREGQSRQRSDTMILCSINPQTGEVALISFLRDLYVQIPGGYSDNRLNAPYVFGGFSLLDQTLSTNFGISIDGNFEVDFSGFEAIIDLIGGVEVEMTAAEAKYLSWIGAVEGTNLLNGAEALDFARIRKLDSDFGRTDRQRRVLLAVYDKIRSLPAKELLDLMYEALSYVTTDLTDTQILSIAYRLLPLVSSMDIETHSVPFKGSYKNVSVRGMAVLMPDLEKIRDKLEQEYLPLD